MRVLVTGAAGFIGSHVVRALVEQGDDVTAISRPGRDSGLPPTVTEIHIDLADADLGRLVREVGPDASIHLAWHVDPATYLHAVKENLGALEASVRLLSALNEGGCRRLVLAGTCLEPGNRVESREAPQTIYAAAKAALHVASMQLDTTRAACAHIFGTYGPGERPERVVPTVVRACLENRSIDVTSGEQRRDLLRVEDVASGIVAIMKSDLQGGVDVCSGVTTPLRDVFRAIGEATGRADLIAIGARPLAAGEPMEIAGDSAALNDLGWQPRWSLEAGIADTVTWWASELDREVAR
jgi:nucleoside-diphosphate-sugar epimerase